MNRTEKARMTRAQNKEARTQAMREVEPHIEAIREVMRFRGAQVVGEAIRSRLCEAFDLELPDDYA